MGALATPVDFPAVGASLESNLRQLDHYQILMARTLRQLEDASICVMHGYKDAWEYYEANNPRPLLGQISVPTLIINAEDDPIVCCSTLPLDEMQLNRQIYVA